MTPKTFTRSANVALTWDIAAQLDIRSGCHAVQVFPDGQVQVKLHERVCGKESTSAERLVGRQRSIY